MPFSAAIRRIFHFLHIVFITFILFIYSFPVFAADLQAVLDTNDGSSGFVVQNSSNVSHLRVLSNGNTGIGTITPQGGFVVTNGNVGVGTWSPSKLFDVRGDMAIRGNNLIGSGLGWGSNSVASYATLQLYNTASGFTVLNNQMASLTNIQSKVLAFIEQFSAQNGHPPTMKEIAMHFGWSSTSTAQQHRSRREDRLRHCAPPPAPSGPSGGWPCGP